MKDRNTIDKKYKWNLNDIYENYDIWESDLEKFEKLTKEVPKFKGEINFLGNINIEKRKGKVENFDFTFSLFLYRKISELHSRF